MNNKIFFTVYGKLVAKQSTRFRAVKDKDGKLFSIQYTDPKIKKWQERVRIAAEKHMPKDLFMGPIEMTLHFYFLLPKTMRRKHAFMEAKFKSTKPDCENLMKGIADALEKTFYFNDWQIAHADIWKHYTKEQERVEITINAL